MQPVDNYSNHRKQRRGPVLIVFFVAVISLLLLALLAWPRAHRWGMQQIYPLRYEALIAHYSDERDLDVFLVKGLIQAESSFNPDAVSWMGAAGLMQIMPNTADWLAERMGINISEGDLFNPAFNIRMGTYYLRLLIDMFEHIDTALAAYNAGMGNVRNWLGQISYSYDGETLHTIPFPETREYVVRVNRYMEIYRELYG